jgi:hypothetical protein
MTYPFPWNIIPIEMRLYVMIGAGVLLIIVALVLLLSLRRDG